MFFGKYKDTAYTPLAIFKSNITLLIYSLYIPRFSDFPWKVQLIISNWIWLTLPNLILFAFVSTYHNYFRKSYQNMKLVLLWKPKSHSPFFPTKTCSLVRMVNSIAHWGGIISIWAFLILWKLLCETLFCFQVNCFLTI